MAKIRLVTLETRDATFVSFFLPLSSVKILILIQPLVTEVAIYSVNASTRVRVLGSK